MYFNSQVVNSDHPFPNFHLIKNRNNIEAKKDPHPRPRGKSIVEILLQLVVLNQMNVLGQIGK